MEQFLEFERPIEDLETKIAELRRVSDSQDVDLSDEISRLERKSNKLTKDIFSSLSPWQITQLARHPKRPYTLDYVDLILSQFQELHGDRMFSDDQSIVTGVGRLDNLGIALIGHQKGRDTREKVARNFGMPRPEGYRKAQRIMKLAGRFRLPLVTMIDTPGAYPGIGAEERGQSEAIARSLSVMAELKVPIISVVTGEGGSGGALAIGICDRLLMLEHSTYSVISPEGCASILWKNTEKAPNAAAAMKLTSVELNKVGLVDEVIREPLGGAHRKPGEAADNLKMALNRHLEEVREWTVPQMLERRYQRLRSFGRFEKKG